MNEPFNSIPSSATSLVAPRKRASFGEDFRRFFLRGLAAVLPTLITLWVLVWAWNFLWDALGRHIIWLIKWCWVQLVYLRVLPEEQVPGYIARRWDPELFRTRVWGVLLAVVAVYIVGYFVGNLIGRTTLKLGEILVLKVPVIRAIYPAVKQVTDFVLSDHSGQFKASRVVAVQPHAKGIWSIGLITGPGVQSLNDATGEEMISVFVPSTPTAFSGYVLIVPRESVVELPLSVEEAFRLLLSGGVIGPTEIVVPGDVLGEGASGGGSNLGTPVSAAPPIILPPTAARGNPSM